MKKLIAGLFAAILTTAGLVAVTSTVPAAAGCRAGYECNNTTTRPSAPSQAKPNKPVKVKVNVQTRGNIKADGVATIVVTGPGGFKRTVKAKIVDGKIVNVNIGKLAKPGKYKVKVTFVGDDGFRDSSGTDTITVKKPKKGRG